MPTAPTDPRVDAYIAQAPDFARPILEHVRAAMHAALPDVREDMKWSRPHFLLDGRIFAGMSAFKAHCALGFWYGGKPVAEAAATPAGQAMGQFGRIASLADLPKATALRKLIKEAAQATREERDNPPVAPPAPRPKREALALPDDLAAALRARAGAQAAWEGFAPGQRRDYIEWITEAKRAETRSRRLEEAIGWIAEGKHRHWKYERC